MRSPLLHGFYGVSPHEEARLGLSQINVNVVLHYDIINISLFK